MKKGSKAFGTQISFAINTIKETYRVYKENKAKKKSKPKELVETR